MNILQNQFYDEFLTFDPVTFVPFETKLINYDLLDERAVSAILFIDQEFCLCFQKRFFFN